MSQALPARDRLLALVVPLIGAGLALAAGLAAGGERLLPMGLAAAVALVGLMVILRSGLQFPLIALLVAGYFSGFVKLRFGSMLGYVVPEALCMLLVVAAVLGRKGKQLPFPASPLTVAILAMTAFCLFQFFNPEASLLRSLFGFRSWILYMWLFFAGYELLRTPKQVRQVLVVMLVLATITAIYGIYQWKLGPAALVGQSEVLDEYADRMRYSDEGGGSVFRAFSTYVLPSAFGTNMAVGLLLVFALVTSRTASKRLKIVSLVSAPLLAAGLAASGSRSPLVFLAVGIWSILRLRRLKAVVPAAIILAIGIFTAVALTSPKVAGRFSTVTDLEYVWLKWTAPMEVGFRVGAQYPFGKGMGYTAGVPSLGGFRGIDTGGKRLNVDNGVGAAMAELGVIGLMLFLGLMATMAICPARVWKSLPDGQLKDDLLVAVVLAAVFAWTSFIAVPHAALPWSVYLWTLTGMVFKAPSLVAEGVSTDDSPEPTLISGNSIDTDDEAIPSPSLLPGLSAVDRRYPDHVR